MGRRRRVAADPREQAAYTVAEAAHYLDLPVPTIRYWLRGEDDSRGSTLAERGEVESAGSPKPDGGAESVVDTASRDAPRRLKIRRELVPFLGEES